MTTRKRREWRLEHASRPILLNAERSAHWRRRAEATKEWRGVFNMLARQAKIPRLASIEVVVEHERRDRRSRPDAAGCAPSAKAAVDGLVDAGVIEDDGPDFVRRMIFEAPRVTGRDAMTLVIREVG